MKIIANTSPQPSGTPVSPAPADSGNLGTGSSAQPAQNSEAVVSTAPSQAVTAAKPNKFISFLEAVGADIKNGFAKIDPFIKKGIALAQAAETGVEALDPALGPIFATTVATVASIEQKFAAMGQQSGSGVQKLAEATNILQPVITQAFTAAGKQSDLSTVQNYISAVVGFLNAIPSSAPAA